MFLASVEITTSPLLTIILDVETESVSSVYTKPRHWHWHYNHPHHHRGLMDLIRG